MTMLTIGKVLETITPRSGMTLGRGTVIVYQDNYDALVATEREMIVTSMFSTPVAAGTFVFLDGELVVSADVAPSISGN